MKPEIETWKVGETRTASARICPAPSLRVPVTAANRALLRQLRQAELTAWESADGSGRNSAIRNRAS